MGGGAGEEEIASQCCHQVDRRPQVFTVARRQEGEPVYQEIGEQRRQKKKVTVEEPPWAPQPQVAYGRITTKEVARYLPPDPVLVRPDKL